jgi:glutathione S-transferase
MLTLHHLERSRSQRVLWMLEELEIPYEIVRYQRDAKTLQAPPELEAIHPLGKSPVVVDEGHTIAESGAILEYLRYRYFMHYAEGSLMPPLLVAFLAGRVRAAPLPFFVKPIARKIVDRLDGAYVEPNLRRHIAFLEHELGRSTWLAGDDLTAADVQMSYPMEALVERAAAIPVGERIRSFVARVHERPAYRRAAAQGGPAGVV